MAKILKYGLLQYDIKGSSQATEPGFALQLTKTRLMDIMKGIVSIYNGGIVNAAGDGAIFAFPVHDNTICPMDWVAQAGLHCLRTIDFLNEPWNPSLPVDRSLEVRVSCHLCDLIITDEGLSGAHGDGLNWFVKHERQIGKVGAVTITSDLYREINNIELKDLFSEVLTPLKYSINGRRAVKDLYIFDPSRPLSVMLTWDKYWEAVKDLAIQLIAPDKRPDLIIGLARGGAVAGDLLSRLLDDVPYVTLWLDRPKDTDERTPSVSEAFFDRKGFHEYVEKTNTTKLLIIDDHCKTGDSLMMAHSFIEKQFAGLPDPIISRMSIKIAVLSKEQFFDESRKVELNYCIHDDMQMMPYGRG